MKEGGIILEGSEQSFKSTIANKLSELTKMPIIHMGKDYGKDEHGNFDYVDGYFVDVRKHNSGLIIDRSYVSELVYGPIVRGHSNITLAMQRRIEYEFTWRNYFIVFLHRYNFDWKQDLRPEYVTKEQNEVVRQKYLEVYETIKLRKFLFDPSNPQCVNNIYNIWLMTSELSSIYAKAL